MTSQDAQNDTYLLLGLEFLELLSSNGLTIEQVFKAAGVEGLKYATDPAYTDGKREIFMVLIGSAAVISAATPLIANIIQTLVNRPVVTRHRTLTPATDKDGKVLVDRDGQPIMQWSDVVGVDRAPPSKDLSSQIKTKRDGVEINIGSK